MVIEPEFRCPLFVVTSRDRRGGQVAASVLATRLALKSQPIELVALADEGDGLQIAALGASRLSGTTLRHLRSRMVADRVVVGFGSSTLPACAAAGIGRRSTFVYRSIGDPLYWCNTPGRRLRTRIALHRARKVVALWEGAANAFSEVLGVPREKLTTIPNGVDNARFTPATAARRQLARRQFGLRTDAPTILCLGSLSPEKRIDSAIDAVAKVDGAQLLVAGDGPMRAALEGRAAGALDGRYRFAGVVAAEDALAAADILLLPSLSEGMPAAVLEAAFAGVPSVASDVGALHEMVCDGHSGRLLPVDLDVGSIASAVGSMLDDAPSFGAHARAHCTGRFDLTTVSAAWISLLDELSET